MEKSLKTQFFLNFIHFNNNSKVSKIKKTLGQHLTYLFYETLNKFDRVDNFLETTSRLNNSIFYKGVEKEVEESYFYLKKDIENHVNSCWKNNSNKKLNIFEQTSIDLIKTNLTKGDKTNRLLSFLVYWKIPANFPDMNFHYFFMYPLEYGDFHEK